VNSPALGNIPLQHTSFDRIGDQSQLGFYKRFSTKEASTSYSMGSCKDGISLSEAIRVIESIRFLQP
jgi:hypothetical protein